MVLWIGVDDTDSLQGMCTTFLATELVRALSEEFDIVGYPRLVRLNPNVPWKTRGNGAVCLRVGRGVGMPVVIGRIAGRSVKAFPRGDSGPVSMERVADIVASLVERWSAFDDPTTHPAFVVLRERPSPRLYWRAVRVIVDMSEALEAVRGQGVVRMYKDGRGVIGASAAVAWRPRDRTYEVLAYREPSRWGTQRDVDPSSVREMDRMFPTTFNNYDYENERVAIAPRSPCPILFGIRGDRVGDLPGAMEVVRSEPIDRWALFETNQGTDDHVHPGAARVPRTAVRVSGTVRAAPQTVRGGHVVIRFSNFEATVYEPAKQFRSIARLLMPGDRVQIIGSMRDVPRTVNVEKLRIDALAPIRRKVANPRCDECGKRMKSTGRGAPFRCSHCGTTAPPSAATFETVARSLRPGWYEPPTGSRRHLSKPLKRAGRTSRVA
ncbi:MAG: TiaS agmantine-binding domain-containing protein [Methanobacteriota archaeon]